MKIESIAPQLVGKKLRNIVRIVLYMLRKGMSKSKLILDIQFALQHMLKRGKIAGKTISNLVLYPNYSLSTFNCKSNNDIVMSFITCREYEFSNNNTSVFPMYFANKRRRNHRYKTEDIVVVHKIFEMLNTTTTTTTSYEVELPGFGKTPKNVRQLRVTDSPFSLQDSEENYNSQVDKDAEEFINKFYKDLKQQKRIAALESPSPYHVCAS